MKCSFLSFIISQFLSGHSRPLFLYFCLFNTVDSKQMFYKNFDNDWIQTADLWYWKRPLYQLSHNHCPYSVSLILFQFLILVSNFLYLCHTLSNLLLPFKSLSLSLSHTHKVLCKSFMFIFIFA